MGKALAGNGSPVPEFETDEERSSFITRVYVHELFTGEGVAYEEERDDPDLDEFIRSELRRNATVSREERVKSAGVSK